MDHVVHYRTGPGETKYERVGSLEEAVDVVERVHADATDVRVYKQVPIEIKTFIKVSVVDGEPGATASVTPPAAPAGSSTPPAGAMTFSAPSVRPSPPPAPAADDEDDAPVDGETRRASLFGRG